MPSSLQARRMRRAISPRLAISTFSIMWAAYRQWTSKGAGWRRPPDNSGTSADHEQRLVELDRLTILDQNLQDRAGRIRLDLIHHLHGFDDAQRISALDRLTDFDK